MKWTLASRQSLSWRLHFCCSLTAKGYSWVNAASSSISVCSGEITTMLKAAGLPRLQHGRYISMEWERVQEISDGIPFYKLVQQNGQRCRERHEEHHAYVSVRHCFYRSHSDVPWCQMYIHIPDKVCLPQLSAGLTSISDISETPSLIDAGPMKWKVQYHMKPVASMIN